MNDTNEGTRSPEIEYPPGVNVKALAEGFVKLDKSLTATADEELIDNLRAQVYEALCLTEPEKILEQVKHAAAVEDPRIRSEIVGLLPYLSAVSENTLPAWHALIENPITRSDAIENLTYIAEFISEDQYQSPEIGHLFLKAEEVLSRDNSDASP